MNLINEYTAIRSLLPNADFTWASGADVMVNGVQEWMDSREQPTDAEIQAEILRLQTEYDNNQYARERKARYDSLNQFEMQYDDAVNGTTTWQDAINAIKQEIPKGGN